jgi:hypothetical protein
MGGLDRQRKACEVDDAPSVEANAFASQHQPLEDVVTGAASPEADRALRVHDALPRHGAALAERVEGIADEAGVVRKAASRATWPYVATRPRGIRETTA